MMSYINRMREKLKSYNYHHLNVRMIVWLYTLLILGINVIASATDSSEYESKQLLGIIAGSVLFIALTLIDYHFILRFYWLIYFLNLGLLLSVKLFGENHKGAQRWFKIAGIQFQPSEFAKIFIILFLAMFIMKYKDKLNTPKILGSVAALFGLPLLLVLKQPDLSTSIVIVVVFCAIIFVAGLSRKIIGIVLGIAIPAAVIFIYLIMQPDQKILDPYQLERLVGFYDEDSEIVDEIMYQQKNSVMAIGSGGLLGKGLNNDREDSVKNGNYISEAQTDFIFTIVGEELGFVGTISVILLIMLICFECFYMGAHAPDVAGKIICIGMGTLIAFQSFVNIGVATMILPNTGLPLPFVSYGLSSLLSLMMGMGICMNVGLFHKRKY